MIICSWGRRKKSYDEADYNFDGDSLIQLDDERILSFYCRNIDALKIYEQKEFKEILSIDLEEILNQNNKKTENFHESEKTFELSVIQLKNKSILVGLYTYLIEIKLNEKSFESKVIFEYKENILNINELPDGKIILITNNSILVLNDFILKDKYNIKNNWKIIPVSLKSGFTGNFDQYFASIILPDERILLRSFSTELSYYGGNRAYPSAEFNNSKIIFINTKNFKEIKTTEEFKSDSRALVYDNLIIIQDLHDIYLYDIKTLDIIKKMGIEGEYCYFEKYNENEIIAYSIYENINDLLIYRVEGRDIFKICEVKKKFRFKKFKRNYYDRKRYNNKVLFVLKDKRIILLCHNNALLLNLNLD